MQSSQCALTFGDSEDAPLRAGYLLPPIELDAVRSLPGSRSFFMNLGEMDVMKEESFLSLSNSPDALPHRPVPRCACRASMVSSSLHHRAGDCAWMLEESSPELKVYDDGDEDDARDWRQFHVDWVRSIS